ncbi:hypothetical protein KP79_PYT02860 [Mizuhopecten yessoensis]|uniref:HECT domain-containing protein n=1 Tax=Mizuhopecten yessoensis TaxID=6573 RepID=A0A210PJY7_MIZYE|nr:hypothetical protein KP79_PYT02860 [Mizuhopecten yessoensis]
MKRLGLKHFRYYLLAKNSEKDENLPQLASKKMRPTKSNDPVKNDTDMVQDYSVQEPSVSGIQIPLIPQPDKPFNDLQVGYEEEVCTTLVPTPVVVEYLPDLDYFELQSTSEMHETSTTDDLLAVAAEDSGIVQFGSLPPNDMILDATLPDVHEITVHRGFVCRDLIAFFSHDQSNNSKFEIKMLKEDGTQEIAEDNGGVMRDALSEFWDTFYLQYTEGNSYKVSVIRHDMTGTQWRAVAKVIKMGYGQEGVFPIKLAPSFMQQAIFGQCNDSEVIDSFLKFVPMIDKVVFETSLKDFSSVSEEIVDVLDQYDVKTLMNEKNIHKIVGEIAHKELIQKPMFVADSFHKVLQNTQLVGEEMALIYSKLLPSPKKVLNALIFPKDMSQDEMKLSSYVKKLVREMDQYQYLELFLRFCTGSDLMTK